MVEPRVLGRTLVSSTVLHVAGGTFFWSAPSPTPTGGEEHSYSCSSPRHHEYIPMWGNTAAPQMMCAEWI